MRIMQEINQFLGYKGIFLTNFKERKRRTRRTKMKLMKRNMMIFLFGMILSFQVILGNKNKNYFETSKNVTNVTVTGSWTISVEADTALISVGIITEGKTCKDASENNSKISEEVIKGVKNFLKNVDTIETQNYDVYFQYQECLQPICPPPKIIGCEVDNSLLISTQNLNDLGSIIDAAISAGANQVDLNSFVLSNSSIYQFQALTQATQFALKKIDTLASKFNESVVSISSFLEDQFTSYNPSPFLKATPTSPTSIQVGLIQISSTVTIQALLQHNTTY